MRDKAYKRDLRRALEQLVVVKSVRTKKGSHIEVVVVLPDGTEYKLTAAGSPRDHQYAIDNVMRDLKKRMRGTYE